MADLAKKKIVLTFLFLCCFLFYSSAISEAVQQQRNRYEDTVTESMWDWATTLGKSPQEKERIKDHRRMERVKARAEKKAKIKKAESDKLNKARAKEEVQMREARKKAQRKRIAEKLRKLNEE